MKAFEEYKIEWSRSAACRKRKRNEESEQGPKFKQSNLTQMLKSKCSENRQTKFDDLVMKFVVNGMRPLSVVEDPDFVNLFEGMAVAYFFIGYVNVRLGYCDSAQYNNLSKVSLQWSIIGVSCLI